MTQPASSMAHQKPPSTASARSHDETPRASPVAGRGVGRSLFADQPGYSPANGDLTDGHNAEPLFRVVEWAVQHGVYPYQHALQGCSGPTVRVAGRSMLMFSSYDYLGLIGHPAITAAACQATQAFGTSSGGVRLLTGTTALHDQLDAELARFKGTEAAVSLSSGFMANLAVVAGLLGPGDRVIMDRLAHRSIADGCRVAGVDVQRFEHNDPESLRQVLETPPYGRRTLIAIEGIYSMEGDICPLPEIVEIKREHGAFLMVDEAHSLCVLGKRGRGVNEHFGMSPDEVDLWVGTLSKAIPSNGGFVAGKREVVLLLQHAAAAFIFSAALCPSAVAAALAALAVIDSEPERIARARSNARLLRERLQDLGFDTGRSASPIVPVMLGEDTYAHRFARKLFDRGVLVTPVVHPAVPKGAARLRLCATAGHTTADIEAATKHIGEVRNEMATVP